MQSARNGSLSGRWIRAGTRAAATYHGKMANLTLVYGMRLLPADEIKSVGEAPVQLQNGNEAQVTMHVLEGSREQIEGQLRQSIDAFFDFYPEI
jgi:hypothetical protein